MKNLYPVTNSFVMKNGFCHPLNAVYSAKPLASVTATYVVTDAEPPWPPWPVPPPPAPGTVARYLRCETPISQTGIWTNPLIPYPHMDVHYMYCRYYEQGVPTSRYEYVAAYYDPNDSANNYGRPIRYMSWYFSIDDINRYLIANDASLQRAINNGTADPSWGRVADNVWYFTIGAQVIESPTIFNVPGAHYYDIDPLVANYLYSGRVYVRTIPNLTAFVNEIVGASQPYRIYPPMIKRDWVGAATATDDFAIDVFGESRRVFMVGGERI